MPESRDRLVRDRLEPTIFSRRSVGGYWIDTDQEMGVGNGGRNLIRRTQFGSIVTMGRGGSLMRSPLMMGNRSIGQENRALVGGNGRRGGGGGRTRDRRSALPSWYPRRPLQDITAITAAIERRRARIREADSHRLASPLLLDAPDFQQELGTPIAAGPPTTTSLITPKPTDANNKRLHHHLPLHMFQKTNYNIFQDEEGESEFITPQKKLLNSIDQVEKVMKEEFKRMKRTPVAKRAERDTKVRTLMTMR
ncbi:negative regulation of ubiquitin-protein transferase [Ranunculus cassubicifolius]